MPAIVMYVKPGCPYCEQARTGLREQGEAFEERDATSDPAWREDLMRFSRGTGLVPTLVRGDEVVAVGWHGHG